MSENKPGDDTMPLVNLFNLFKREDFTALPNNPSLFPNWDNKTRQKTIVFPKPPQVVYVKKPFTDPNDAQPANLESDLLEVELTEEETEAAQKRFDALKAKRPNAFDGVNTAYTHMLYDTNTNTIYLVARKVYFSTLLAVRAGDFNINGRLGTDFHASSGVINACITADNCVLPKQRNDGFKLYSDISGLSQPIEVDGEKRLNHEPPHNMMTLTANHELHEELTATGEASTEDIFSPEASPKQILKHDYPVIRALSFRYTEGRGDFTAEFITTANFACTAKDMAAHVRKCAQTENEAGERLNHEQRIALGLSKDGHEQTGATIIVPLDPANIKGSLLTEEGRYPNGVPLIAPVITAALVTKYGLKLAHFTLPGTETHCSSMTIAEELAELATKRQGVAPEGGATKAGLSTEKKQAPRLPSAHVANSVLTGAPGENTGKTPKIAPPDPGN